MNDSGIGVSNKVRFYMRKKLYVVLIAFAALVCLYSCTKDKTTTAKAVDCTGVDSATNTYNLNIYPNITGLYCAYAPCHGGASAQGGVDLTTYASTVSAFKNLNVICAVTNAGCILMPNGGPALPDSLIQQMKCWQSHGYPQ